MSSKLTLELNPAQVEELAERLPMENKVRLARKLDQETLNMRIGQILKNIDRRRKKHPISAKEIDKIVEEARTDLYEERRHRH